MNPAFWLLAAGFLLTVIVIALVHRISPHCHSGESTGTKDRIWALEKLFFGLAVAIVLLGDAKELFAIFQGGHPSEDIMKTFSIALIALAASGALLLLSRLLDAMLGDE